MMWILVAGAGAAGWGYHCWAVVRAYKAGAHAGKEQAIGEMAAW